MTLPTHNDYRSLFLNDTPMMDVRAPVEFSQGAFPSALNVPILDDRQRELIGTRYKQEGQEAAIALGEQLASEEIRAQRIKAWRAFAEQHPDGVLYCFRGGLRSRTTQRWLHEQTGMALPLVEGGYKAMRRFLIETLEQSPNRFQFQVIGGRTGVGKTEFIKTITAHIDLEGRANHRGSAFGPRATPQPKQIDFENRLAIDLLRHEAAGHTHLLAEDEGANVGSVSVPLPLFTQLSESPLLLLEVDTAHRVEITHREYVGEALAEHCALFGEDMGFELWRDYVLTGIDKIRRRLGSERHRRLRGQVESALAEQKASGNTDQHRPWIETLLVDYYDPMYDYQLSKKQHRIVFRGDPDEMRAFIAANP